MINNPFRKSFNQLALYIQEFYRYDIEVQELDNGVLGCIDYTDRIIHIHKKLSDRKKFLILCHEIGHLYTCKKYQVNNFEKEYTTEQRENFAFLCGYYYCRKFSNNLINKSDWLSLHNKKVS